MTDQKQNTNVSDFHITHPFQDESASTVPEDGSQNTSLTTSVSESDKPAAKGKQVVS